MKCQRRGCKNHATGVSNFRKAYVTDKRPGKKKSIKKDENGKPLFHNNDRRAPVLTEDRVEMWCLACAGAFEPDKYRMVYDSEGRRTTTHRVPLEPELRSEAFISAPEVVAPIIVEEKKDVGGRKASKSAD